MNLAPKDIFSDRSSRYRPRYPKELFDVLLALSPGRSCAWDCGMGNGQVASVLAEHLPSPSRLCAGRIAMRPKDFSHCRGKSSFTKGELKRR